MGEDAAEHFLDYVQTTADKIFKMYIKKPKEMIYTEEERRNLKWLQNVISATKNLRPQLHCHRENETTCDLCIDKPDVIVRDHCHILGVSNHSFYCFMFFLLF